MVNYPFSVEYEMLYLLFVSFLLPFCHQGTAGGCPSGASRNLWTAFLRMPDIPFVVMTASRLPMLLTSIRAVRTFLTSLWEILITPLWEACCHLSCSMMMPALDMPSSPRNCLHAPMMASDASCAVTGRPEMT